MNLVGVRGLGRIQVCAAAVVGAFVGLNLQGCTLDNPGITPPSGVVNFPIALALSGEAKPKYLFVANANFDLRYNAGSVQAYNLEELEARLNRESCRGPGKPDASVQAGPADADVGEGGLDDAGVGDASSAEGGTTLTRFVPPADSGVARSETVRGNLCDGRRTDDDDEKKCCFGDPNDLSELRAPNGEVQIDSFASGLALGAGGDKLYVPVRSKARLLYIDVNSDGDLSCSSVKHCRRGPAFQAEARTGVLDMPSQPEAVVTGKLSEIFTGSTSELSEIGQTLDSHFIATSHDTGGISLFTADPATGEPHLEHVLATGLRRVVGLAKDPMAHLLLLAPADAPEIGRVGVRLQCEGGRVVDSSSGTRCQDSNNLHLQLERSSSVSIFDVSQTYDVRDVVVDSRPVAPGEPRRFYALLRGRDPNLSSITSLNSIVFFEADARTTDTSGVRVVHVERLGSGLNRLVQATVGKRHLLFASGYNQRVISVVDADARRLVESIGELSGPYDLRVDAARELLYVADFNASVVRVIDLRGLNDPSAPRPRIVATVGAIYNTGSIQ